ncbi:MAG: hypothetical protein ACX98W_20235 [bacterium]
MSEGLLQIVGIIVQVLGVVLTAVLTYLIYRVTSAISTSEAVRSINKGWGYYNQSMLMEDNFESLNAFLKEDGSFDPARGESKVHFLLYMILNNLSNEYYSTKSGTLEPKFTDDSIEDYLQLLHPRMEYVLDLMKNRGYDSEFIEFAENQMTTFERESAD